MIARWCLLIGLILGCGSALIGQPAENNRDSLKGRSRTINQRIAPVWSDATHFSFVQETTHGDRKTMLVDATNGSISAIDEQSTDESNALQGGELPRSQPSALETSIEFVNASDETVTLHWIEPNGRLRSYGEIEPGKSRSQHTFTGHAWMVDAKSGHFYGSVVAKSPPIQVEVKKQYDRPRRRRNRREGRARSSSTVTSANGRYSARNLNGELQIRDHDDESESWQTLETDSAEMELLRPQFSPDGAFLAAWMRTEHGAEDVFTVESSPAAGGRAQLQRRPYRLPGDPMDEYELVVFECQTGDRIATDVPTIDFGRPRIHWFDENKMAIEKVDRGHQRVRLFVIDPSEPSTKTVVDESTDTFIWTMHGPSVPVFTYLEKTDEVIYASERSGYRHLYLVALHDGEARRGATGGGEARRGATGGGERGPHADDDERTGRELRADDDGRGERELHADSRDAFKAITSGDWLVREIINIDEDARTIDLMVGEFYDDQDPYHKHLVRVGVDDQKLIAITKADGDHSVQFSPDSNFVIATHSRVDSPPVHELRRCDDGTLVTELMRAKRISKGASRWARPHVFHAPGRDGETEIWGNLYFPDDFDPKKKAHHPVIEAIYAGPHDSHVPKRYLHSRRFSDLRELGFVVVQIDGMGTANRSKAFHDKCWHNIKDAGFPDRIAWMKAAAKKYPALDVSRVGIFGTSAGGQNACGAVLFHGDFYRAAYAACGCHDNRMDKASWNEQWMGYPVGEHYSSNSNIDNAHRLQGDLFLVVGELDSNVPPESTYRLVDALIKADKTFDFLMVPGMGHSDGGSYGRRRMRDFFVEKLMTEQD